MSTPASREGRFSVVELGEEPKEHATEPAAIVVDSPTVKRRLESGLCRLGRLHQVWCVVQPS